MEGESVKYMECSRAAKTFSLILIFLKKAINWVQTSETGSIMSTRLELSISLTTDLHYLKKKNGKSEQSVFTKQRKEKPGSD